MTLPFSCPSCEYQTKVKDDLAGRRVRCPKCSKTVLLPKPEDAEEEGIRLPKQPPAKKRTAASRPRKQSPRARLDHPEEDEAPPREKEKQGGFTRWGNVDLFELLMENNIGARCLGVVCLGLGALLAYLGLYLPFQEANTGQETIWIQTGGVAGAVVGVFHGLLFLIAGKQAKRFLILNRQAITPLQTAWIVFLVVICLASVSWLHLHLRGLGYSHR